jgi:MraZ protein
MSHFLGTHQNRLDAKGRVSVPAPFRNALRKLATENDSALLVLRASHQLPCIEAWPGIYFDQLTRSLDRLELFSEAHDDMALTLFSDAWPVEPDREGRIVLPDELSAHAGLGGTTGELVAFMGMGKSFAIWEPAAAERRRIEARERARTRGTTLQVLS